MLIAIDKALEAKLGSLTVGGVLVKASVRGSSNLFDDKNSYPLIAYMRINNSFDASRYDCENQLYAWNSVDAKLPPNSVNVFEATRTYNLMYQVDCMARDNYGIDALELHMDKVINPISDFITFVGKSATEAEHTFKFKIRSIGKRPLDDFESQVFRRVYTLIVEIAIDFDLTVSEVVYEDVTYI